MADQIIGSAGILIRPIVAPNFSSALRASILSPITAIGGAASGILAGIGIAKLGTEVVKSAADFQTAMHVVQSVSGASRKEMDLLRKQAIALGNDIRLPGVSAKDAAESLTQLVKGGLSLQDAMKAVRGALQLATAGEIEFKEAARLTTSVLQAFHLRGQDATKVADLLAAAANASSVDVHELAFSLQQASAGAHAARQTVSSTVTALALLANAGIRGSDAGTSLKVMFQRLVAPTEKAHKLMQHYGISVFDTQGKVRPLRDLIQDFSTKLGPLADKQRLAALQTIFGTDAMRAANIVLLSGVGNYDKLHKAVSRSGAAQELAAARTKGFNGAMDAFKSSLQTLAIVVGTVFLPPLTQLVRTMGSFLGRADVQARLKAWAEAFARWLVPAVKNSWHWISTQLIPAALTLARLIRTDFIPWLREMGRVVGAELVPHLSRLAAAWRDNRGAVQQSTPVWITFIERCIKGAAEELGGLIDLITLATKAYGFISRGVHAANAAINDNKTAVGRMNSEFGLTSNVVNDAARKTRAWVIDLFSASDATRKNTSALGGNYNAMTASQKASDQLSEKVLPALQRQLHKSGLDSKQFSRSVDSIVPAFEGVRKQSTLTAAQLNKNLRDEVRYISDWAKNSQILLKRGADPKWVAELSRKGPQYVAAYVRGSDRQMREGQRLWTQREQAKTGTTKTESGKVLGHVQNMVNGINDKMNRILDENVSITAKPGFQFSPTFTQKDWLAARQAAGRMATGGLIRQGTGPTADDVPIWASKGEYIVNAESTKQYLPYLEWVNAQKLAGGGVVSRFSDTTGSLGKTASDFATARHGITKIVGNYVGTSMVALLKKIIPLHTAAVGGGTVGGTGVGGTVGNAANAWRIFRAAFGLPMGGRAPRSNPSDHPIGKAIDLMTTNRALHRAIIALGKKLPGAKYWISYRQIGHARDGFRPRYYGGASPHSDHVHWSFYERGGLVPRTGPIYAHAGEGVLNRKAMMNIGSAGLAAMNTGAVRGGDTFNVTVQAQTNADPHEIAREMAWQLRTSGR